MSNNYKINIQEAQKVIQNVVIKTALEKNNYLSEKYNCEIYFKREDQQIVRSYKIRGAYNLISSLTEEVKKNGITCASAGNHAQGVAYTCKSLKIQGDIFMPLTTPKQKISQVKNFGNPFITIHLVGDTFDDCANAAKEFTLKNNLTFIPPFDHLKIIEGQGTVALELAEQLPEADYIICPVGGGGLIAGITTFLSQNESKTKVIGVEPKGAASMTEAIKQGQPVKLETINKFVDGAAVQKVGELNFEICKDKIYKMLTVDEGKACTSILKMYNNYGIIAEPAGALSVSVLDEIANEIEHKKIICIISGGNNDIERMQEIKERSLIYEGLKHYLIITLPQRPGSFKLLVNNCLGENDDIVRLEYLKKNNKENASMLVGIEFKEKSDYAIFLENLKNESIEYLEINNSEKLSNMII